LDFGNKSKFLVYIDAAARIYMFPEGIARAV